MLLSECLLFMPVKQKWQAQRAAMHATGRVKHTLPTAGETKASRAPTCHTRAIMSARSSRWLRCIGGVIAPRVGLYMGGLMWQQAQPVWLNYQQF